MSNVTGIKSSKEFFVSEGLKLYTRSAQVSNRTYIFLVNKDDDVILHFTQESTISQDSMRITMHNKGPVNDTPVSIACYPNAIQMPYEAIGIEVFNFVVQCYVNTIDYNASKPYFQAEAHRLRKEFDLPFDVCILIAKSTQDTFEANQLATEILDTRTYGPCNEYSGMLQHGSKTSKRYALRNLLGDDTFKKLQLENRGWKFLNALAYYFTPLYNS